MSQTTGPTGRTTGQRTAERLKSRFGWLQSFSDDELRQITYCASEDTMRGDETYFDISHPERGLIEGRDGEQIPEGSCYVPRSEVPRNLWDKLTEPFSQAV